MRVAGLRRDPHPDPLPEGEGEAAVLPPLPSGEGEATVLPPLPSGEGRGEGHRQHGPEIVRARRLRRDATPAERKLWPALRSRGLTGAKFRRQYPCGPYILDFAEFEAKLVVEINGDTHAVGHGPVRDAIRDRWLSERGWRVLRFTNHDVSSNLDGVLQTITAGLRRDPHPDPLPGGEGAAAGLHP